MNRISLRLLQIWRSAQAIRLYVKLVKDPNRTAVIFKIVELAMRDPNQAPVDLIEGAALADPGLVRLRAEGYLPDAPNLDELARLPEGTFGRAVWTHMNRNGLSFELWPHGPTTRLIEYLNQRIYQDHDLWHALLGYGVSVEDELALQAFMAAQVRSPLSALLISGGVLHLLLRGDGARAVDAIAKVAEGYARGSRARFLLGIKLHELLPLPISEVRALCGVGGVEAGPKDFQSPRPAAAALAAAAGI